MPKPYPNDNAVIDNDGSLILQAVSASREVSRNVGRKKLAVPDMLENQQVPFA